jgi:hypothetical protein
VFHPADYAILSARIVPARVGRAFSIHTFSGFLGTAVAPVTMLAVAASLGLNFAVIAAGCIAPVAALPLAWWTPCRETQPGGRAPNTITQEWPAAGRQPARNVHLCHPCCLRLTDTQRLDGKRREMC